MPMFIITGSRMSAAISSPRSVEQPLERRGVVERHDTDRTVAQARGHALRHRRRSAGALSRPPHRRRRPGTHREHHRVVVAVVRALDLDDVRRGRSRRAPRGSRPSSPRCPSCRTAPGRSWNRRHSSSASATVVSVVTAKWMPCARPPSSMASTIFGWAWPTTIDAEAVVEVDVLVAVDVPDVAALALARGRSGTGRPPGTTTPRPAASTAPPARRAPSTRACGSTVRRSRARRSPPLDAIWSVIACLARRSAGSRCGWRQCLIITCLSSV